MDPEVAVVVPTYQRAGSVVRLLRALEHQTLAADRFEVVVVDDSSGDDTPARLAEVAATSPLRIRTLRTATNVGQGAARNLGWRSTSAPVLAFTDDDCVPQPRWLEAGLRLLAADPGIGVAQGRTEMPPGARPSSTWEVYRVVHDPTPWFEGCNLLFRRTALDAAGGFDEGIGWHGEDTAAGWAVLHAGWRRGFADGAVIVHDLEHRGPRYVLAAARREGHLVEIARRYPAIRTMLWRPWAVRSSTPAFIAAAAGVGLARWSKAGAVLLCLPYLVNRREAFRGNLPGTLAQDAVTAVGMVTASIRHRTFLL